MEAADSGLAAAVATEPVMEEVFCAKPAAVVIIIASVANKLFIIAFSFIESKTIPFLKSHLGVMYERLEKIDESISGKS